MPQRGLLQAEVYDSVYYRCRPRGPQRGLLLAWSAFTRTCMRASRKWSLKVVAIDREIDLVCLAQKQKQSLKVVAIDREIDRHIDR